MKPALMFLVSLLLAPGSSARAAESTVTIHADGVSAAQLVKLIHEQTGADLTYLPIDDTIVSIHMENAPLSEVVNVLAKRGSIAVRGPNDRLTLSAKGVKASAISDLISRMTGGQVVFKPTEPDQAMTLDAKDIPVSGLGRILAPFGDVKVVASRR